jgi:hypothetical protein
MRDHFSQLRPEAKQYILLPSSRRQSPIVYRLSISVIVTHNRCPQPMAKLFELPRYIAVEGPIRVGKSTLARVLGERLAAQRVIEPEDNPFLKAFYEGERGAAFQAQLAFLIRRFEQLRALDLGPSSNKTVVSDYILKKTSSLPASISTIRNSTPTIATSIISASRFRRLIS